jgi:tetratricopeptide (TPR) repeat protein
LLFGDYYDAIESYSRAIDIKQDYAEAYYNRALTYLMTYRPAQGCDDLQTCLDFNYLKAQKVITNFCGN